MVFTLPWFAFACGHSSDAGSGSSAPVPTPVVAAKPVLPPPPPVDAAAPAIDAEPQDPFESQLCIDVVTKIEACANDKEFLAALDAGALRRRRS